MESIDEQIQSLLAKRSAIESKPENRSANGSLFIFVPSARKKLDKIAREITDLLAEKRKLQGNPVPRDGYSGRNSNKR